MTTTTTSADRIEKQIRLSTPRSRVWRALTDPVEFGSWFGVKLEGPFVAGKTVKGKITHPGYEHLTLEAHVEQIVPESLCSFRWHPAAVDPKADYAKEPTTLVEFRLDEDQDGTMLSIVESGFECLPAPRRADAYKMNSGGWDEQMKNIERHLAR